MYAKDGTGTDELEAVAGRYTYAEGTPKDLAEPGIHMVNPDYRLPTASKAAAAASVESLEDLMYTIARSNEDNNTHREAEGTATMPHPIPDVAPAWQTIPAPQDRDLTWHPERAIPAPQAQVRRVQTPLPDDGMMDRFRALQEQFVNARTPNPFEVPAPAPAQRVETADDIEAQAQAAHQEHIRRTAEWIRDNQARERARLDALANRTRGIPNRR